MSLQFSDTSTFNGIIQKIERNIYGMDGVGRISGNTTLLKQWTADVNLALSDALYLIFEADGLWQFDDSNHDGYPTVTANLVANQRNYDFTTDTEGNLLLDIHKVYILNGSVYEEIEPVNELNESGFYSAQNATGVPYRYGKKADGIFLDPVPPSNVTAGIKIEVSREGSYFTYTDTTKKPGMDGRCHEYLAAKPSAEYAKVNGLENMVALENKRIEMEKMIKKVYSRREKDVPKVMRMKSINYI